MYCELRCANKVILICNFFVGAISYSMDKAIYHCQSRGRLKAPSPKEIPVLTGVQRWDTFEAGTGAVGGPLAYKALTSAGLLTFRCKTKLTLLGTCSATVSACSPRAFQPATKIEATSHQDMALQLTYKNVNIQRICNTSIMFFIKNDHL